MKQILVTGGLGLIGSSIALELHRTGHRVTVVDDARASVVDTLPDGITVHRHSIEVHSALASTARFEPRYDAVVHCAAPVGPVAILTADVLRDMVSSTQAAIHIAKAHDAHLIALSSSEVYGTEHPTANLVVPDEWSHRVEYGVGKVATEQMCRRHHHETGLPTIVIRPWNVTGPHQAASKGFVLARMAEQAESGRPVTVYTPGTQKRAFMHTDDLSSHIRELLAAPSHAAPWDGVPVDAANPDNATSMLDLADLYGTGHTIIDPAAEHGPLFREAASGSKLPPHRPALRGWTPLDRIVTEIRAAHRTHTKAAA